MEGPRVEVPTAEPTVDPSAKAEFTSPYHLFCKANRPMLPTNLKNADREKLLGEMWKSLSKEGRGAYRTGLALPARNGHGGTRAWVPTQGEEPPPPRGRIDATLRKASQLCREEPMLEHISCFLISTYFAVRFSDRYQIYS